MEQVSGKFFIGFNDFWKYLSTNKIIRTKDGELNISGNILSSEDFNQLYMNDIQSMLFKYEGTISPEFAPSKDLYQTLDVLSSPVLKETNVPEAVKVFYKKLNIALSSKKENRQVFETEVAEYVQDKKTNSDDVPVFMLISMEEELYYKNDSPSPFINLRPSSSELMDGYGKKYNGEDILDLARVGYLEPKEPINMLIFESLNVQNENAQDYIKPVSPKQLLDFYYPENSQDKSISNNPQPSRMHTLLVNGEIDKSFSDLHSVLLGKVSKSEKEDYITSLIDEEKTLATLPQVSHSKKGETIYTDSNNKSDQKGTNISQKYTTPQEYYSNNILEYANAQIIPDSYLSGNITPKFLQKKFKSGEISIGRILEIYETDKEYFKQLETTILTPIEIKKAHDADELEDNALMYLPENSRVSYLQDSKIKLSTIMYLFLHCDGISITDLEKIISKNHILESLDLYIDPGSHASKILELYENYLIDYGCIKNLVTDGILILTEKDMEKYKLGIPKDDVYDYIQKAQSIEINGSANSVPFSTTGSFIGIHSANKDTLAKEKELYQILGNISEQDNINTPVISHKDERENSNFLEGYRVLPLKHSNLVAFLPEEHIHSTYLMPYQETAYILKRKKLPDSFHQNPAVKEIKPSEKMYEDILKTAYQFDEARSYIESLGYSENLSFEEAMPIMREKFDKIRIKGEN